MICAGAGAVAALALFNVAGPGDPGAAAASRPVHGVDLATALPAPGGAPTGAQFLRTPPNVVGGGGFAADDNDPTDAASQDAEQDAQQTAQADIDLGDQEAQQAEEQGAQTQESVLGPTLTGLP